MSPLPAPASHSTALRGILLMLVGNGLLTLSDAVTKWLTAGYPVGQIMTLRALFTLLPILLFAWHAGGLRTLRVQHVRLQTGRALCAVASTFLFVGGLVYLPLADCIAIAFSGPLFVTALAIPMLGERVGWRRWSAVFIGFIGILVMLRPGSNAMHWAAVLPLLGAVSGAFRDIMTRKDRLTASPVAVLAFTMGAVGLAGVTTIPFGWEPVKGWDLLLLGGAGLLVGTAQYLVIHAFYAAEASLIIPFKYLSLIWAALFGYLMWGDIPDRWLVSGAGLVVGSGLYIMHRESQLARRARRKT